MARFQIWLLHRGVPESQSDLSPYYERQMQDPFLLGLKPNWWNRIWMQVLSWWRKKHLPQLPDRCSNLFAEEQGRELERILGTDYQCRTVFRYQGVSAEERIKELSKKTTVVLLAMEPFRSSIFYSMLSNARHKLEQNRQTFSEASPLSELNGYVEAYLETIRKALLEHQAPSGQYAIVFLISKDAKNWSHSELTLEKSFFQFSDLIANKLDSAVPIYRAVNHPSALDELEISSNITDIFYGFPNWVCSSMQEAPSFLAEKGYRLHAISPFNQQPSFIRSLAEVVWEETNNHPSQSAS